MTIFYGVRLAPYIATLIAAVLSGCGSRYDDVGVLAAQSPGIGIEDVEMMAVNALINQTQIDDTIPTIRPPNFFLDPILDEEEIRIFYQVSDSYCDSYLTNGTFRCYRRISAGDRGIYDVDIRFEPRDDKTRIVSYQAMSAPVL